VSSLRGLFAIDTLNPYSDMLYFVIYKKKKDTEYKIFNNQIFDDLKKAEYFGKTSMKRGYEHKVIDYNKENVDKYWYNEEKK
jgi:REP element-mobilizing transposase RayT